MKKTFRILSLVLVLMMMIPAATAQEPAAETPAVEETPVEESAVALPDPTLCAECGQEHIVFPCGLHSSCGEEVTSDSYASHMLMPCGDHYYCSHEGDAEKHETIGAHCGQYMCHNIGATYHTRCRHCGGSLCENRHGRDVCYDFGYKWDSMYIPAPDPVVPQPTGSESTTPTT